MRWHLAKASVAACLIAPLLVGAVGLSAEPPSPDSPRQQVRSPQSGFAQLGSQSKTAPQQAKPDEPPSKLEKQVQLQQKQIQTLEKMVELLTEKAKQPAAPGTVDELAEKAALLEARSLQAARRDQDLARAIDDIFERQDNEQRLGPPLPANLKQLFLPSRTNETPLSIYGVLTGGYTDLGNQVPNFDADLSTFFLLTLNDRFLLESELEFTPEGVKRDKLKWTGF